MHARSAQQGLRGSGLPRFTTRPRDGLALRPLTGVLAERWIVGLSRSDRAAVRLVTHRLVEAGEALTG